MLIYRTNSVLYPDLGHGSSGVKELAFRVMSKTLDRIDEKVRAFIEAQEMFFVATAPLTGEGLVNVSPKGLPDTLTVVDDQTIAYLDLTGSGVETIAHVRENGRICLMFCAFEGRPRIVRIHGKARVLERDHPDFEHWMAGFGEYPGVRSIIVVRAVRVSESCGYGVPLYEYKGHRDQLTRWAESKTEDEMETYRLENNSESVDGLPGLVRNQ